MHSTTCRYSTSQRAWSFSTKGTFSTQNGKGHKSSPVIDKADKPIRGFSEVLDLQHMRLVLQNHCWVNFVFH